MNATPMGDGHAIGNAHSSFPVLRSIVSQTNFAEDMIRDFHDAGCWMLDHKDKLALRPDDQQDQLFHKLVAEGMHNRIMVLHAAPGCGKTVFTVLLMLAICTNDSDNSARRLHWITAPTKTLVTELLNLARQVFPPSWIAPLGIDSAGDDRTFLHMQGYTDQQHKLKLATISEAIYHASHAFDKAKARFGYADSDETFEKARRLIRSAYLQAFDYYNGDAREETCKQYYESVRLALCTATYKLKHSAKERGPINKIIQTGVHPGGHVADEVDASTLSTVVAASEKDVFLLTPTDPAQHMQGINNTTQPRTLDNMSREHNPNDWLSFADVQALQCTRRFGERGKLLLSEVLPSQYSNLTSWNEAPDTTIDYVDLGWVKWTSAGTRAGAVVNANVFAAVLARAAQMLNVGPTMILCIYAATRELLSDFFRKQGFYVTDKTGETGALLVLSARQIRGGTSMNVIACFFRRHNDDDGYIGSSADTAKIVVLLSRMTHHLCIFAESWREREPKAADESHVQPLVVEVQGKRLQHW